MGSVHQVWVAYLCESLWPRLSRAVAALSAIIALFASPALAAEYATRTDPRGAVILTLSGPITAFDGALFLDAVNDSAPSVIEIEGPGGDMLSATRIGVII